MTTAEYEANKQKIAVLRSHRKLLQSAILASESELFDWDEENLAELHHCEDLNKLYDDMEES